MVDEIIEQTKTCAKCGKMKAFRCFYSRPSELDGYSAKCRSCRPHPHAPVSPRFWKKVDTSKGQGPNGECWEWTAYRNADGYGIFGFEGRVVGAHIVPYILTYGPIPKGLHVLHRCDNPPCVNPLHLFLGTKKDNHDDMVAKDRRVNQVGEHNGQSRLTDGDVRQIRKLAASGMSYAELGRLFHVSGFTASEVVRMRRWKHVV